MKKILSILALFIFPATLIPAREPVANNALKKIEGKILFQIIQYDSSKIRQKFNIPVLTGKTGTLQIGDASWKCDVKENPPDNNGFIDVEAKFTLEKGCMKNAGVGIAIEFAGWSTGNYVMIPAIVYNGNRYRVIKGGYMPEYPAEMYYNKNNALTFSDNPRLSVNSEEQSKIELLTGNASTPAMTFFSPSKKQGFIMLTGQKTKFGNSGLFIEENEERTKATFSLTAPGVREKAAGFGGFFNSRDSAVNWNSGDEVTVRFSLSSFSVNNIPEFLEKFMDVRKSFTGENHPRDLTPMSAIFDFTKFQTDNYRWEKEYNIYSPEGLWDGFGYKNIFQSGWVGGMMNTYPMAYVNDSMHLKRVSNTIDFVVDKMQGKSGYFYGIYASNNVQAELKREIPGELLKEHPGVKAAMVRKNADLLFWFVKQLMLLKEQGNVSYIRPSWEISSKKLAQAFTDTWEKYGELGQYIDPATGEIVIFNSTGSAIASGGLALASVYFGDTEFLKVAEEVADYYYNRDIVRQGLTAGNCGDISQDADSESCFDFLESLMALYWATGNHEWLEKAKVVAALGSTWVLSYDYEFPHNSDLDRLHVHAAGAVWASVQNKHAAPGICTASGDCLFKLYRATGDRKYAELIRDIQHAHTEVVETPGRPTISVGSGSAWNNSSKVNYYGCSMERIQPTDAEGKDATGRLVKNTSNGWNELNGMLMAMELPGIYLQTDKKEMFVFDHMEATVSERHRSFIILQIKNPTAFKARVTVFAETSDDAEKPLDYMAFTKWPKIDIERGGSSKIKIDRKGNMTVVK